MSDVDFFTLVWAVAIAGLCARALVRDWRKSSRLRRLR